MTDTVSKAARARAGAPARFVALCKTLYGEDIDAQQVWEDVFKAGPGQADLATRGQQGNSSLRRDLERGSNALGLTAAGMATGAALRDERLANGGKVARALYRTGQKIPAPISRIGGRKGALLAGGALLTQGANMAGDVAIGQTLKDSPPQQRQVGKALLEAAVPAGRGVLVPTELVGKADGSGLGLAAIDDVVAGTRKVWNQIARAGQPKPAAKPKVPAAAQPTSPNQPTLPGLQGPPAPPSKTQQIGNALGQTASTRTGQIGLGLGGAAGVAAGRASTQPSDPYASMYGKRDDGEDGFVAKGVFTEIDEDQHLAFGWASVTELGGVPVVDRQGDVIETEEIAKAAYDYVHGSRVGGDMHRRNGADPHKVSDLIESIVFTDDKVAKMGLPHDFPRGWWVGFKIHDPETWAMVKDGRRTGFSIHGSGSRVETALDDVMGYAS